MTHNCDLINNPDKFNKLTAPCLPNNMKLSNASKRYDKQCKTILHVYTMTQVIQNDYDSLFPTVKSQTALWHIKILNILNNIDLITY